ncbi:hypothetical protein [Pseudomonas aeruginosa]|uniref:hypothetical protein n=1 Tax=Pseudomonas aeruginosa TaxID=287 RepID=UPI00374E54C3
MPVPFGFLQALEEVGVRDAQRGNLLVLLADLCAQRADQCVIGGLRWALSPSTSCAGERVIKRSVAMCFAPRRSFSWGMRAFGVC